MVNLDQIKQLEERVSKAIEVMQNLKDENDVLKLELHDRQKRIEELENIVLVFRNDQAKIEEGILNALNHLSAFEDTVSASPHTSFEPSGGGGGAEVFETSEPVSGSFDSGMEAGGESSSGGEAASDTSSQEAEDSPEQLDIF